MKHLGLVPIRNFAVVDAAIGFYRSAQPEYSYEYTWLKHVAEIDVIINLRAESVHDVVMTNALGIKTICVNVHDHHEPSIEQAHEYIALIKRLIAKGKKFLIHCEHGHGRTSTFCVLGRLAQGYTLDQALREETQRFHYSFKHEAQMDFLKTHFSNYNKQ